MAVYYNEIDPFAAETLRNMIAAGMLPAGDVDTRSIEDVCPDDLRPYVACHFFAGIGIWPLALRRIGWPDGGRIWSGSCPCQPFSTAGAGGGFDDERHLWPAWFHLISQCGAPILVGEQVASRDADSWISLVQADMEALGGAFAAVPFTSAGVGAPHIRERLYWGWLADADGNGHEAGRFAPTSARYWGSLDADGSPCRLVGVVQPGLEGLRGGHSASGGQPGTAGPAAAPSQSGGVVDAERIESGRNSGAGAGTESGVALRSERHGFEPSGAAGWPCPTDHPWRDADWLYCRDDKWRPVEPGSFPLAYGLPRSIGTADARLAGMATLAGADAASLKLAKRYRLGALKAYGNAINLFQAEVFLRSLLT